MGKDEVNLTSVGGKDVKVTKNFKWQKWHEN